MLSEPRAKKIESKTIAFGSPEYWENSYQKNEPSKTFDWLENYNQTKHLLNADAAKTDKILMVGCGNSLLTRDMHLDGYSHIVSTDISPTCIDQMKILHADHPDLVWEVQDVTSMPSYSNSSFDCVVDKGTLDAICCGDTEFKDTAKMMIEMHRLLKDGGKYLFISFGPPERRLRYLDRPFAPFEISCKPIHPGETNPHYYYTCIKKSIAENDPSTTYLSAEGLKSILAQEEQQNITNLSILSGDNLRVRTTGSRATAAEYSRPQIIIRLPSHSALPVNRSKGQ